MPAIAFKAAARNEDRARTRQPVSRHISLSRSTLQTGHDNLGVSWIAPPIALAFLLVLYPRRLSRGNPEPHLKRAENDFRV